MKALPGQIMCGCGHKVADHGDLACGQWRRYPEVLDARQCGCQGAWRPNADDSRFGQWQDLERMADR